MLCHPRRVDVLRMYVHVVTPDGRGLVCRKHRRIGTWTMRPMSTVIVQGGYFIMDFTNAPPMIIISTGTKVPRAAT